MIGKIDRQLEVHHYQPSSFTKNMNFDNSTSSTEKLTSHILNIKNSIVNARVINKESSLFKEASNNDKLVTLVNQYLYGNQSDRFKSLGMAVSGVDFGAGSGKAKEAAISICDNNPRDSTADITKSIAINNRGKDYIKQFITGQTILDSTNYAVGLMYGSNLIHAEKDDVIGEQFALTWNLRLNQIS